MSFFKLSNGQEAEAKTTFEMGSGKIEPIPDNTILLAMVTEARWDEYGGSRYISLRWDVVGKEYTKRVIFQKIKVEDPNPTKRDRQIMMLMAIDANSGGHLQKLNSAPTDTDLANLCHKKMGIQVAVWKMKSSETGEDMEGNWIKFVSDAKTAGSMLAKQGGNPKPIEEPKVKDPFDDDELEF